MNYDNSLKPERIEFAGETKMLETAKMLVEIVVKAQMTIYDVDRETAREWVIRAAEASQGRGGRSAEVWAHKPT
jgi:hypothetical protein